MESHSDHNRVFRYTFTGNNDLEPGSIYRIEYVSRVKILWISLRLALWGEGASIDKIVST